MGAVAGVAGAGSLGGGGGAGSGRYSSGFRRPDAVQHFVWQFSSGTPLPPPPPPPRPLLAPTSAGWVTATCILSLAPFYVLTFLAAKMHLYPV